LYEYDFGDLWQHQVRIEQRLQKVCLYLRPRIRLQMLCYEMSLTKSGSKILP
jgi:hypothetical protein